MDELESYLSGGSNAQAKPTAPHHDELEAYLSGGASVAKESPKVEKTSSAILSPLGEVAANVVTGGIGSVLGGLSGIATLIRHGGDTMKASQAVKDAQDALTYQPRSAEAQTVLGNVATVMNKSNEGLGLIGKAVAGDAGQAVGEIVNPVLGAIAGGKAGIKEGSFRNAAEQFKQMRNEPLPPQYGGQSVAESFGKNTVNAAETPIAQAAKASGVNPELQAAIDKAETSGKINKDAAANHIAADTLPVPVKITEGQATGDVHTISAEQNSKGKYQEFGTLFNEQNAKLIQNLDAIRENAAPDVFDTNHIESGRSLINSYKEHDATLKSDIKSKYEELAKANGGDIPIDGQTFVANANAELGKQMKGAYLPKETQSIMNDILSGGRQMTFENFENLRTNLANDARKFERQGDGNSAHAIGIVRNALEDMPLTEAAQGLKPIADAARSAAKQRFDLLKTDPAYKAAINGTVAPDDFINKYVINGKQDHIEQMKNNLGADPIASQTISNGVINYLKSKSVGTAGNFSQAGFNGPLSKLEPNLHMLVDPQTAAHLTQLGHVAKLTQAQPRGSYVNNSNTLTAAMGNAAATGIEAAINLKTGGIGGTWLRKGANAVLDKNAVKKSMKVGAGI
jgi:hypothetical protein